MTKHECAIVMAYTGACMLSGEDFNTFHEYIEKLMGRPVWTHELADKNIVDQIKEKSKTDFLELCRIAAEEDKLEKIEQIVARWNNDASHSFEDMCKINGILKE